MMGVWAATVRPGSAGFQPARVAAVCLRVANEPAAEVCRLEAGAPRKFSS